MVEDASAGLGQLVPGAKAAAVQLLAAFSPDSAEQGLEKHGPLIGGSGASGSAGSLGYVGEG